MKYFYLCGIFHIQIFFKIVLRKCTILFEKVLLKFYKVNTMATLSLKGAPTAQVTPAASRPNTSTLSGRSNPNKPQADGGAQPAPKNSPSIGTTYTKPNCVGGMPKK
jgi:hypothetical protein